MGLGDVKGAEAQLAWRVLYEQTGAAEPTWNFKGKFVVGRDGAVAAVSPPTPAAAAEAIEAALDKEA